MSNRQKPRQLCHRWLLSRLSTQQFLVQPILPKWSSRFPEDLSVPVYNHPAMSSTNDPQSKPNPPYQCSLLSCAPPPLFPFYHTLVVKSQVRAVVYEAVCSLSSDFSNPSPKNGCPQWLSPGSLVYVWQPHTEVILSVGPHTHSRAYLGSVMCEWVNTLNICSI